MVESAQYDVSGVKHKEDEATTKEEIMITVRERLAENDERILQKGIARGIATGIAQERNKRIIIAKNLINMGMKKEDVLKITGVSSKEIEN